MNEDQTSTCPDCGRPIPDGAPQGLCPKCLLSEAAAETVPMEHEGLPAFERVKAAFPSLEILECIGRGGMGVIYKARQRRLDRLVALKLLSCPQDKEDHFADRFLREARALAKLNHPHIVTVYDFGESHGYYYLLMEFVDGVNLRQAMSGGKLSPEEALRIVPVVCDALQYAHDHGVLHRDIKPANILLNRAGEIKMADFGLAKFVGNEKASHLLTQTEASLGTPAYMAPEQSTDPSRVDHRADIYSLGVVFYEMLTGELPLGRFPAPSTKAPVDHRVDDVVMRTLEREPEERYQSAKEVKTDVQHISEAAPAPKKHAVEATKNPEESRFVFEGGMGALLVVVSLIGTALITYALKPHLDQVLQAGPTFVTALSYLICLAIGGLGTAFGWSAAARIRREPERYFGIPVAGFAALTWPLLLLVGSLLVINHYASSSTNLSKLFPFLVAILIILAIRRFYRWTLNQPGAKHWYWAFYLIIFGLPLVQLAFRPANHPPRYEDVPRATAWNDLSTLKRLLERGRHVDERNEFGATGLMIAATEGDRLKAEALLEYGANVNAKNPQGYTPVLFAAAHGHTSILELLLANSASLDNVVTANRANALHLAAHNGHRGTVDLLANYGLSVDARNAHGETPLMLAAGSGYDNVLPKLLHHGGRDKLESVDNQGRTALDHAIRIGQSITEKHLLEYGAQKTPSWWLREAFTSRRLGWIKIVSMLEKSLDALEAGDGTIIEFGFNGWYYTLKQPRLTLHAMIVEAATRADQAEIAQTSLATCLNAWPDADSILVLERQNSPSHPTTFQTLRLRRDDVEHPLRSSQHDAKLSGFWRKEGPNGFGKGNLSSETFFK